MDYKYYYTAMSNDNMYISRSTVKNELLTEVMSLGYEQGEFSIVCDCVEFRGLRALRVGRGRNRTEAREMLEPILD